MYRRIAASFAICMLVWLACKDTTVVQTPVVNWPPLVLYAGAAATNEYTPPEFEVIAGDPDGLDDIAAVYLDIDSIVVRRIIARPSRTNPGGCLTCVYAPNDTVSITALVPRVLPGLGRVLMTRVDGGLYRAAPICSSRVDCSCGPCLRTPPLGPIAWSGCISADAADYLTISPPAVPNRINVFITYLDVEYRGIHATVADASGETATRAIAIAPIVYEGIQERTVDP